MTSFQFDTEGDAHSPSPSEALVEEIARAMFGASPESWEAIPKQARDRWCQGARAVLAAKPIVDLVEALRKIASCTPHCPGDVVDVARAALLPFSQRETGSVSEIERVDASGPRDTEAIATPAVRDGRES
jgi:hypothetical protein